MTKELFDATPFYAGLKAIVRRDDLFYKDRFEIMVYSVDFVERLIEDASGNKYGLDQIIEFVHVEEKTWNHLKRKN